MTREIRGPFERISNRSALIMGAALVGGLVEVGRAAIHRNAPNIVGVKSYYEDEGPSFIFVRGCGENYQAQAPLLHKKVGGYGSLHFEYQVDGLHSQKAIDQNIIAACKEDGERDRVLVCTSMGLMNTMRSLKNPAVRDAIGKDKLKAIVSRSGITSKHDLQTSMQQAAHASLFFSGIPVVGNAWRISRLSRADGEIEHSKSATAEEARLHHESSAYMPFHLVASQYRAIHYSAAWEPGSHTEVVEENPDLRLYQLTAEYDGVADWKKTNKSLQGSFELPVETIIDERRHHGSHADDLEFIEPLEELMMKLSGRSRAMAAAARNLVAVRDMDLSMVA